jgi:hypothetical protein
MPMRGVYARQADKWKNLTQRTEERGNDVQRHLDGLADWTGPASEKAKLELSVLRASLHDMTAELGKIPPVLMTLHETLTGLQRQLVTTVRTLSAEASGSAPSTRTARSTRSRSRVRPSRTCGRSPPN